MDLILRIVLDHIVRIEFSKIDKFLQEDIKLDAMIYTNRKYGDDRFFSEYRDHLNDIAAVPRNNHKLLNNFFKLLRPYTMICRSAGEMIVMSCFGIMKRHPILSTRGKWMMTSYHLAVHLNAVHYLQNSMFNYKQFYVAFGSKNYDVIETVDCFGNNTLQLACKYNNRHIINLILCRYAALINSRWTNAEKRMLLPQVKHEIISNMSNQDWQHKTNFILYNPRKLAIQMEPGDNKTRIHIM